MKHSCIHCIFSPWHWWFVPTPWWKFTSILFCMHSYIWSIYFQSVGIYEWYIIFLLYCVFFLCLVSYYLNHSHIMTKVRQYFVCMYKFCRLFVCLFFINCRVFEVAIIIYNDGEICPNWRQPNEVSLNTSWS